MRPAASFASPEGPLAKPTAILMTDIVGSTPYFERQGNALGLAMLERHNSVLFPVIERAGGRIVKTIGDAILAVFENPAQAVKAAVAMQRELRHAEAGVTAEDAIHIRIGVHYGMVFQKEEDVFGEAVNLTERVKASAASDQIRISSIVRQILRSEPAIRVESAGVTALKGFTEEIELFEVLDAPPPVIRSPRHRAMRAFTWAALISLVVVTCVGIAVALKWRTDSDATNNAPREAATGSVAPASVTEAVAAVQVRAWSSGGSARLVTMRNRDIVLHSGEAFQIAYTALQDRYVYAMFYDAASQKHVRVFPRSGKASVSAGLTVWIPPGSERFVLDQTPGKERVFLVMSEDPANELLGDDATSLENEILRIKKESSAAQWAQGGISESSEEQGRLYAKKGDRLAWTEVELDHR